MGVLDEILAALAREADLEWLMIDSTIVRAHQHAAGASRQKGRPHAQGLRRSRGGLSTKIHAAGDGLGNPVRLIGSPGQLNDIAFAHELIEGFAPAVTIAGKGYDADHLCDRIAKSGGEVVIPPKRNQTVQRLYDADLYKERNIIYKERKIIERFFNKLKQFRRVATRYDKLLANIMGFLKLAAIAI
jgi:putative transposase